MRNNTWCFALASLCVLEGCAAPVATGRHAGPGAVDETVVSRQVEFDVASPREQFVAAFYRAPLARFIKDTAALPGVDHTEPLTDLPYPASGSVRRVVLRDGNSAREEVLESDDGHLLYLVTGYSSPQAEPIEWGLGEFTFASAGATTHVTWRYSFKLRPDTFPGSLGAVGRALFRCRFLERDYAEFMEAQVREIQAFASSEVVAALADAGRSLR